jgi:hypothetical protein
VLATFVQNLRGGHYELSALILTHGIALSRSSPNSLTSSDQSSASEKHLARFLLMQQTRPDPNTELGGRQHPAEKIKKDMGPRQT